MTFRTHAVKLSYLLVVFAILLVVKPSVASSPLSSKISFLKQRLMEAKPHNVDKLFKVDTQAKQELAKAMEVDEADIRLSKTLFEFERYCEDSVVAFNLISSLENEIEEGQLLSGIEKRIALAEDYVSRVENRRIELIANTLLPIQSKDGNRLSATDPPPLFTARIEAIIELKTRLHLAGPSFEFDATTSHLRSLEAIEHWRSMKTIHLELVSTRPDSPVYQFEVQHVQAHIEFARYCEEELKASEALKEFEADLRDGSLQLFSSAFNDRLIILESLVSKVEGHQILYHEMNEFRDMRMFDALKKVLELAEPGIFVPENPKDFLIMRQNELVQAKRRAQQVRDAGNLAIRREVRQAMANLQYAMFHQKTWKAFKVIESLQDDIESGTVEFDSIIFEKRFAAAQDAVSNIPSLTLEQTQWLKRLVPKKL